MITILEGGDGTGKSTLGSALARRARGKLMHYGRPYASHTEMYALRIERELSIQRALVLDRSWIGSKVWARMGFHPPVLRDEEWLFYCHLYATLGTRVFILVKPESQIEEVLQARGETAPGQALAAIGGQRMFLELVQAGEILYLPVAVLSPGMAYEMAQEA